jgi:hypothetical protein
MSRRTFVNDLRRACSMTEPVNTDHSRRDSAALSRVIQKADVWLTPKILENFRIEEFHDLPADAQQKLNTAVEAFRDIAASVPSNTPATKEQWENAYRLLTEIVGILQPALRDEWLKEIAKLEQETECWCRKHSWPTERRAKRFSEALLGEYEAPRLHFFAFDKPFVLEPIGRFAPGAYGLFDLAVIPTYDSTTVSRAAEKWYVHPVGDGARRPWSEESFLATLEKLAALS